MAKKEENKSETKVFSERLSVAGFTLGLAGFYSLLIDGLFSLPFFLVGLTFSIIQRKKGKDKMTKTALILNLIGIILWMIYLILFVVYILPYFEQMQFSGLQ